MAMKIGTSYFGNRIPRHVAEDMKQLRREGFNLVCHTFNENDHLFYRDTMKEIVHISKDLGFEVHMDPWGVGKVFGGESFSNFVATNMDALQILSDDKPAGNACPMHPKFRGFMIDWIEAALECGADVLFWDEPHFSLSQWLGGRPGQWGCRCPVCQEHFRERFGHEMPYERNAEVVEYLEWAIRDFLAFVIKATADRGAGNNLCLLPHEAGEEGATADWGEFAALEGLTVFGTDPYFQMFGKEMDYLERFTQKALDAAAAHNRECQIWFQGFKIPDGAEERQAEAIKRCYDLGVRNMAVWGFEACAHISWIRPANPEKLWRLFVETFKGLE